MKLFFGGAIDVMAAELRAQGVDSVRLHVLPDVDGQVLRMRTYVTTYHNDQIYEAVAESSASLGGVEKEKVVEFVRQECELARESVAKRFRGFEIRPGILQE